MPFRQKIASKLPPPPQKNNNNNNKITKQRLDGWKVGWVIAPRYADLIGSISQENYAY